MPSEHAPAGSRATGSESVLEELGSLVDAAKGRPERLGPSGIRRLGALHRQAVPELARARQVMPGGETTRRLEATVAASHALIYGAAARSQSLPEFAVTGYWRRVREAPWALAVSACILLVPGMLGFAWGRLSPGPAGALVPGAFLGVAQPRPHGANLGLPLATRAAFATTIFTHNIAIAFLAFGGGMTAGIVTVAAIVYNGVTLGIVAGLAAGSGEWGTFLQLVAPHGVLELSCIVVAGASGLRVAASLVVPGRRPRREVLVTAAGEAVEVVLGTAAWLVVAGTVEGFVTPTGLGTAPAIAVGLGLGTIFWALVAWRGRPAARGDGARQ